MPETRLLDPPRNLRPDADKPIFRRFTEENCESALLLAADLGLSAWTIEDYRDELARSDSEMTVAIAGSRLAGFIVGRRVPSSGPDGGLDAEIYNIGVARDFQGSGVGSELIAGFIEWCRSNSVKDIWLEVRARNAGAIRFYRKSGFRDFGVRRSFYRDPADDAIIMRLELNRTGL